MTAQLPPNLLQLFAPRPPVRYIPPADHAPESRKTAHITGIAAFVPHLQEKAAKARATENGTLSTSPSEDPEYEHPPTESWLERRTRETLEKQENQAWLVSEGYKELYKPREDENIRNDGYKTLFVARLPFDATVADLEREFGRFGAIERVRIVVDNGEREKTRVAKGKTKKISRKGKSRGYGFVVFEKEKDMKCGSYSSLLLISLQTLRSPLMNLSCF